MSAAEVVVVGAGPAGSATAALLARAGHDVMLVDRARFPRPKACAEYISPGAVELLDQLHVSVESGRRLRGMNLLSPDGSSYLIEYRSDGVQHTGASIARRTLDAALLDRARREGAQVREGFRVTDVLRGPRGEVQGVRSSPSEQIHARLVVGADGLHSVVARDVAARRAARWPRRLGLVAHVQGVAWPENQGEMHVGHHGYVGVAPLDDAGLVSVGLVRPLPTGRLGSPEIAFDAALAEHPDLARRLARGRRAGPVQGVGPLAYRVEPSAGAGFLLVGDAAGFFDPFTGEGIYRALRGAQLAARAAIEYLTDSHPTLPYDAARLEAFRAKERLTAIVQVFVQAPGLMNYAVRRLRQRPALGLQLGRVLGDLAPASSTLQADFLWRLLRP